MAMPIWAGRNASAQVTPPIIPPGVFNVTVANPLIDGGQTVVTTPGADNSGVINAFLNYAASNGGGTVEVPAGTYGSNTLDMQSNVNLQLDSGATIQNLAPNNTLVQGFFLSNFEISGGGILNDNASAAGSSVMVALEGDENFALNGVTIENASLVHFNAQFDENVTVNSVTIADPLGTKQNGDGIDYSGNNFLFENCNISDGDDDIVAKPSNFSCSNITITNCTIGLGHGISIGGQTNAGLVNMTVTNCTFNGTTYGIRLKAGRTNGGLVQNVSFSNITMTNVDHPVYITGYYDNGSDTQPPDADPNDIVTFTAGQTPQWNNISFNNVVSNDPHGTGPIIYGLPESPITAVSFNHVNFSSPTAMQINFAGFNGAYNSVAPPDPNYEILFNDSTINGIALTPSSLTNGNAFKQAPSGNVNAVIVINAPEPASAAMMGVGIAIIAQRRRARSRKDRPAAIAEES
jgi:polygalacturonase